MMIRVISSSLHTLLPPPVSPSPPYPQNKCIATRYLLGRRSDDHHHRMSRFLHILRSANTDEYNEEPRAPETEQPAVVYVSEETMISSETAADSVNGSEQTAIVAIAIGVSVIVALGVATQYGVIGGTKNTDPIVSPVSSNYVQKDEVPVQKDEGTGDKQTPSVVIDPLVSEPSQDSPTLAETTEKVIGSPTSVTSDVSVPVEPVDIVKDGPTDGPATRPTSKLHTWTRHKRR